MHNTKVRMKQHEYALSKGNFSASAIADHFGATGHKYFNLCNPTILGFESDSKIRKATEAYFIRKNKAALNRKDEMGHFNQTWFLMTSWPK